MILRLPIKTFGQSIRVCLLNCSKAKLIPLSVQGIFIWYHLLYNKKYPINRVKITTHTKFNEGLNSLPPDQVCNPSSKNRCGWWNPSCRHHIYLCKLLWFPIHHYCSPFADIIHSTFIKQLLLSTEQPLVANLLMIYY